MTDTSSLRAFIEARLTEEEEGARNALDRDWRPDGANSCCVYAPRGDGSNRTIAWCRNGHDDDFANALHIARHDPARVLREVAAKRRLLALAETHFHYGERRIQMLLALAEPFADHPDYRTEWSAA